MSSLVIKAIKTLPKITIKKPQITIKDLVTTKTPSQVSGTEILASQQGYAGEECSNNNYKRCQFY